jgi:predicted alpha/beta-fold hydrolase
MTVFAWAKAREFPDLPAPEARLFQVATDTRVLAHCFWQPARTTRPTLLALHGLEGSSSVHYMLGLAAGAWTRGWNAVLLNQRNCGETEHLTPGLYHSGLTADPRLVIRELATADRLTRFGIAGYSLGGNLALKLAGELGAYDDLPVRAVAAVSPTIDLDLCVRAIERRVNLPYHWNFVRRLRDRMRRKAAHWPGAFDLTPLDSIRTIRRFDDVYTAPHHGFAGSTDYYFRASALRVIDQIRLPALILAASDDPMVPTAQFDEPAVRGNPHVVVRIERYGGHCGFVARTGGNGRRYWAESAVLDFLASASA